VGQREDRRYISALRTVPGRRHGVKSSSYTAVDASPAFPQPLPKRHRHADCAAPRQTTYVHAVLPHNHTWTTPARASRTAATNTGPRTQPAQSGPARIPASVSRSSMILTVSADEPNPAAVLRQHPAGCSLHHEMLGLAFRSSRCWGSTHIPWSDSVYTSLGWLHTAMGGFIESRTIAGTTRRQRHARTRAC
jgi:hypothetical protein